MLSVVPVSVPVPGTTADVVDVLEVGGFALISGVLCAGFTDDCDGNTAAVAPTVVVDVVEAVETGLEAVGGFCRAGCAACAACAGGCVDGG